MGIDSIIRDRLFSHPDEWAWSGPRFLNGAGIHLVRGFDERWTFVVGEQRGYIKLSVFTHGCIELARLLKNIPDSKENKNEDTSDMS